MNEAYNKLCTLLNSDSDVKNSEAIAFANEIQATKYNYSSFESSTLLFL